MDIAKVQEQLVQWLHDQVAAAGAKGIAIALSGGIDSAVVAGLAKYACGENIIGLILPCHSLEEDEQDALLVAEHFGIETMRIDLAPAYDALLAAFQVGLGIEDSARANLAAANIKPRLRMNTLYYFATRLNYLVTGTGNLSEATVGYFTKYGDGGVDLQPIAGLVKREVRELAQQLGVPSPVITKAPSAGLWSGQTDENEMGFSYELLDNYIRTGEGPDWLRARVEEMRRKSEHKRHTPPVGPVL